MRGSARAGARSRRPSRGRRTTRQRDPIHDAREIVAIDGADEVVGVEYEREPVVAGLRVLEKRCRGLVGTEGRAARERPRNVADAFRTPFYPTAPPQPTTAHDA